MSKVGVSSSNQCRRERAPWGGKYFLFLSFQIRGANTVDVACFKFHKQEYERESEGKTGLTHRSPNVIVKGRATTFHVGGFDFFCPQSQPFQGDNRFDLTFEI